MIAESTAMQSGASAIVGSHTCGIQQVSDDLEAVALINEELLPFGAVIHLLRVLGNQRIEESIVLLSTLSTCM